MTLVKGTLILIVVVLSGCAGLPSKAPDGAIIRDPVYVEKAEILQQESFPVQVLLRVEGQLPDPCHDAVWAVADPDPHGRIYVDLHSEAPPALACIQVLQPVAVQIPIGALKSGNYTIWLNGERVGDLDL